MKKQIMLISSLIAVVLVSGCAMGGGASVYSRSTDTNGVTHLQKASVRPFITWGDASQAIIKQRLANTKLGNSIGQEGYTGEASATNVAPIIKGAGELIGNAVKAFVVP